MRFQRMLFVVFILAALVTPASVQAEGTGSPAAPSITCRLPKSNAEALEILSNDSRGYWWDHTDLTIAIQSAPNVSTKYLKVVHAAIKTWSDVLRDCFDGRITLTNVTGAQPNEQKIADIVVHYVAKAGGAAYDGFAICNQKSCPNILVRSDLPPQDQYTPQYVGWVTLHEIGHALGLGHATNLEESTDLMGYGWPVLGDPVLSRCDIEGIAFVFAWAFEGSQPHPPADGPFRCT